MDNQAVVVCPHCGEEVEIGLDWGGALRQEYIEDCQVCCSPWRVVVQLDASGHATVNLFTLDD